MVTFRNNNGRRNNFRRADRGFKTSNDRVKFNSNFTKAYGIDSIPRYILIDPEGNIVTGNAPRPSDPTLIDLFNSLDI